MLLQIVDVCAPNYLDPFCLACWDLGTIPVLNTPGGNDRVPCTACPTCATCGKLVREMDHQPYRYMIDERMITALCSEGPCFMEWAEMGAHKGDWEPCDDEPATTVLAVIATMWVEYAATSYPYIKACHGASMLFAEVLGAAVNRYHEYLEAIADPPNQELELTQRHVADAFDANKRALAGDAARTDEETADDVLG